MHPAAMLLSSPVVATGQSMGGAGLAMSVHRTVSSSTAHHMQPPPLIQLEADTVAGGGVQMLSTSSHGHGPGYGQQHKSSNRVVRWARRRMSSAVAYPSAPHNTGVVMNGGRADGMV